MLEIATDLELEVELENVTELLQSHDKLEWMRVASYERAKKVASELENVPGEDTLKIIKITTKMIIFHKLS